MRPLLLATLTLALLACTREGAGEGAEAPRVPGAAAGPGPAPTAAPPPGAPAATAAWEVTEERIRSYARVQRRQLELKAASLRELREEADRVGGTLDDLGGGAALRALEEALSEAGLSEAEYQRLHQLVVEVIPLRIRWKEGKAQASLAETRRSLEEVPEEFRAQVEANLQEAEAGMLRMREAAAARARFGDAAVDLVIRHEAELSELYTRAMASALGG